jgi:hypothetical protein
MLFFSIQAARRIQVAHLPTIFGPDVTYASVGDSATVECSVVSFPEPKVAFWRNFSLERIPIVNGGNFRIDQIDDSPLPLLDVSLNTFSTNMYVLSTFIFVSSI